MRDRMGGAGAGAAPLLATPPLALAATGAGCSGGDDGGGAVGCRWCSRQDPSSSSTSNRCGTEVLGRWGHTQAHNAEASRDAWEARGSGCWGWGAGVLLPLPSFVVMVVAVFSMGVGAGACRSA
eukprot:1144111-Pelagomonas_calceolata.AAC.2